MDGLVLVVGPGDPLLADFVAFAGRGGLPGGESGPPIALVSTADVCRRVEASAEVYPIEQVSREGLLAACGDRRVPGAVVFLGRRLTPRDQVAIDAALEAAVAKGADRVCVVSSFLVHFGDRLAARAEAWVQERVDRLGLRAVVFRPAHVLSPGSRAAARLRSLSFCYPLVPARLRSCWVDGDELFAAVLRELNGPRPRPGATYTLLGPNRSWRSLFKESANPGLLRRCLAVPAALLGVLGVGHFGAAALDASARWRPGLRRWNFDTLRPRTNRELLALYNKYNHRHVKVVGYNNGVVHFGQAYPERTVVATARCDGTARVNGRLATFDAGTTVGRATEVLGRAGKELYVLPNYSYVSLGTGFFVPIHGSASEYSTMEDTIEKVLLYDPVGDRFLTARRQDPAFRECAYNRDRDVLLLRLRLRVKDKSTYYREQETLEGPTGEQLLATLRDQRASNVEVRQARAADQSAVVSRYYTEPPAGRGEALPFPKDSLGKLWDRLEANAVSSYLFHALARRLVYHVELFFEPDEFVEFWRTHGSLPLLKVQLRYIKQDDLPHSPFLRHDCVSVDTNMHKKHRRMFLDYVKKTFRTVQFNPGKHSM